MLNVKSNMLNPEGGLPKRIRNVRPTHPVSGQNPWKEAENQNDDEEVGEDFVRVGQAGDAEQIVGIDIRDEPDRKGNPDYTPD